jgi:hypothetical protein
MKTITFHDLERITGGAQFDPTVDNCRAAFKSGQITANDLQKFKADHGFRGTNAASNACFGKASWGGFGFSEAAVKKTFGVE